MKKLLNLLISLIFGFFLVSNKIFVANKFLNALLILDLKQYSTQYLLIKNFL